MYSYYEVVVYSHSRRNTMNSYEVVVYRHSGIIQCIVMSLWSIVTVQEKQCIVIMRLWCIITAKYRDIMRLWCIVTVK